MSDYIDRQAAIDEIDEWIKAFRENGHKESAADACLIQDGIIQLPSVQPDIIQCKDCINWQREWEPSGDPGTHFCYMVDGSRDGDWYCAAAEKRG